MKAKDILKALVKSGMVDFSIGTGETIKKAINTVLDGDMKNKKEYLYSFKDIGYINYDVKCLTIANEIVYLYEI